MIRYPGLTELAEKYGYLVVAPMGLITMGGTAQDAREGNRR